jgi:hypothetical protein
VPRHWYIKPRQRDAIRARPLALQAVFYLGAVAWACAIFSVMVGFLFLWAASKPARAQHNHHQHHAIYQNWFNKNGEGCCNNQDCGELAGNDERTSGGVLEVRIEGQWCPVLSRHYLKTGNVPNASVTHVCVWRPDARPDLPHPCQRLLCYQPRPLS